MKISGTRKLKTDKVELWKLLSQFSNYPDWMEHCISAKGEAVIDENLQLSFKILNFKPINREVKISAVKENKYLSYMEVSSKGLWWWNKEFVFRIVEEEENTILLHYEIYCYGLRFRAFKESVKTILDLEVLYFLDAVKNKLNGSNG